MNRRSLIPLFGATLLASPAFAQAVPEQLTLEHVLTRVEQANPDVAAASSTALATGARARAAGRLPDAVLRIQQWDAPAARPLAIDEACCVMVGLEQTFPLAPKLRLRRQAESARAGISREGSKRARAVARANAIRAFFDLWRAEREQEVHLEHVGLAQQILDAAESQYTAGRGRQQDVLRAGADLARLHTDVSNVRQQVATSRAVLLALMDLPESSVIGKPEVADSLSAPPPAISILEQRIVARPEVRAADLEVDAAAAEGRLASAEAWLPDVMVGAEYWDNQMDRDGWAGMVSINLPWLSAARWDAKKAAKHEADAARARTTATRNGALAEVRDAYARWEAAHDSHAIFVKDVLPLSQQSLESARAAYVAGTGTFLDLLDASRSYLEARLSADRARARYEQALADLELAAGSPLSATNGGL